MIEWVARLPTTNLRILVTICAFILVMIIWLSLAVLHSVAPTRIAGWEPSGSMIAFLSVWAALDVGQFFTKRKTQDEQISSSQNRNMSEPPRPSD